MSSVAIIQDLAARGLVNFGGDSVSSMGGRGVTQKQVIAALRNTLSVDDRYSYLLVTGSTEDAGVIVTICTVSDRIYVSNVEI